MSDPKTPIPPKVSRHIQPLGPRILVRLSPEVERSPSGLYLPKGVQEEQQAALFGQVVEVARSSSGDENELGENVSGIPSGVMVLFPKEAGLPVPWDEKLRLIATKDVVAIVQEIGDEETH